MVTESGVVVSALLHTARAAVLLPEMADNLEEWHLFSEPLEGRVHSMYLDIKGLVTTGVGNLIDSVAAAQRFPWRKDFGKGRLATPAEIAAAWRELKSRQDLAKLHWAYAAKLNDLRLTDEDIDALVTEKLFEFEAYLERHHFPDWRDFPADAQLAICSMAWACGPGFPRIFKNFARFASLQQWANAKACCTIREAGNPGVVPRNVANRFCFDNAARVVELDLDRDKLFWPGPAHAAPPPEPSLPDDFEPEPELVPLPLPEDWHASLERLRKQDNLELYDR